MAAVAGLAAVVGACADKAATRPISGADPARGLEIAEAVGCGACHVVPGVPWPQGRVGGTLEGFAAKPLIAGRFPNQPDRLIVWLRNAPSMDPDTGMPAQPLTESEARDVAAYLMTLK